MAASAYPLLLSIAAFLLVSLLAFAARRILYTLDAAPYTDSGFKWLAPDWSDAAKYPVYVNTVYCCVYSAGTLYLILSSPFKWIILRRACFLTTVSEVIYFVQLSVTRFPDPNPALHNSPFLFDMYHVVYVMSFLLVQFYEYSAVIRAVYLPLSLLGLWLLIPTHMFYTIDIITAVFSVLCVFFIYHWYCRNTVAISKRRFLTWFEGDALEFLLKEDEIYNKKLLRQAAAKAQQDQQHHRRHAHPHHDAPPAAAHQHQQQQQQQPTGAVDPDAAPVTPMTPSPIGGGVMPSLQFYSSGAAEFAVGIEIPRERNHPEILLRHRKQQDEEGGSSCPGGILGSGAGTSGGGAIGTHSAGLTTNLVGVAPGTASSDESMRSRNQLGSPQSKAMTDVGAFSPTSAFADSSSSASAAAPGAAAAPAAPSAAAAAASSHGDGATTDAKATPPSSLHDDGHDHRHEQPHHRPQHRRTASGTVVVVPEELFDPVSTLFNPYRTPSYIDHKIKADVFQRAEERLVGFVRATYTDRQKWMHLWGTAALGVALGVVAGFANLGAVQVTDVNRPIGVPLPRDIIFENFPKVWDHTADVFVYTLMAATGLLMLIKRERFTMFRRTGTLYFSIMIWRIFTVTATFPVDPSPICKFREHPPGTTCGDLIYSGHTVALTLTSLVWSDYFDGKGYIRNGIVTAFVWCFCVTGLIMVVLSKLHYTRDVLTACVVVTAFYHMWQVSVFLRPDVLLRHSWLRWFELDTYIVLEQDGKYAEELTSTTAAADSSGTDEAPSAVAGTAAQEHKQVNSSVAAAAGGAGEGGSSRK
jgi:hypothetical protein